jgi:hypothetical protein
MLNETRFYWRCCDCRWTPVSPERAMKLKSIGEQVRIVPPGKPAVECLHDDHDEPLVEYGPGPAYGV